MRTEPNTVESFTIYDAPKLDPVTVVLQDLGAGNGRLIVECYGKAWSAYWGAMGDRRLRKFITDCHPDYIANRLHNGGTKRDEAYVHRIVGAVHSALRSAPP